MSGNLDPPELASLGPSSSIAREVVDLHRFFQAWFTGTLEATDEEFARFERSLAANFELITPSGARMNRDAILTRVREAHGSREAHFRIGIENVAQRAPVAGLHVVTYEEWQEESGEKKGRISTALLRVHPSAPGGYEWFHVHEVWLP